MKKENGKNLLNSLELSIKENKDIYPIIEQILRERGIPTVNFYHNCRKDVGTIDDYKQEFRIAAIEAIRKVNLDRGDPIAFILNYAYNRIKNFMNRCSNRITELVDINDFNLPYNDTDEIELMIDIEDFIEKLPNKQKQVAILLMSPIRDEKNYLKSIANKLGISPQCVNIYLNKIRQRMVNTI